MTHDEIRLLAHDLDRTDGVDKIAGELLRGFAELLDEAETLADLRPSHTFQLGEMVARIHAIPPGHYFVSDAVAEGQKESAHAR